MPSNGGGEVARIQSHPTWRHPIYPRAIDSQEPDEYSADTSARMIAAFFRAKGLRALKDEDRQETWYSDWIEYQATHKIYASVLTPKALSTSGCEFRLLRYAQLLELFGYFSPAHGYSLQVTFLGLFSILMGANDELKREAVARVEEGELLAFGVSERHHGADLLANEFTVSASGEGSFIANGAKHYIGNSNVASLICILGRKEDARSARLSKRATPMLIALRPQQSRGFRNIGKIRTLGIKAAYVGEFDVRDHPLPFSDVIAEGRGAWDSVLGTVTLGKFFLGFGSIGICEHALREAVDHLGSRILYRKPALAMPHIRALMTTAYVRLAAMKLFAYRALDYVRAATPNDRRYLLFCAVQKSKVSTEGVRVMDLLGECVGARGFESDTYFEMASRDARLIPSLEGSAHINLGLTAQFIREYFGRGDRELSAPASLVAHEASDSENSYLFDARATGVNTIVFAPIMRAYAPLATHRNVRVFVRQIRAFRLFIRHLGPGATDASDSQISQAVGKAVSTIAYGQLVAENSHRLEVTPELIATLFHVLIEDLSAAALAIGSLATIGGAGRTLLSRVVSLPRTTQTEWDRVSSQMELTMRVD